MTRSTPTRPAAAWSVARPARAALPGVMLKVLLTSLALASVALALPAQAGAASEADALLAAQAQKRATPRPAPRPQGPAPGPREAAAPALGTAQTDRLIVDYGDAVAALPSPSADAAASAQRLSARLELARAAAEASGVSLRWHRQTAVGAHVLQLDRPLPLVDAQRLAASLQALDPSVRSAAPDRRLRALGRPNDPGFHLQWSLTDPSAGIALLPAWSLAPRQGQGVVVAVIDTGLTAHADLAGQTVAGYDFIDDLAVAGDGDGRDADASDPGDAVAAGECGPGPAERSSWHGTHVAGIVAAKAGNGRGIVGVAPQARLQPVRVLGKCGGYESDVIDAIVWASGGPVPGVPANTTPARVLNLSLGGFGACGTAMQQAVSQARSRGSVVVVAAGNSGVDVSSAVPANCRGVLAIAASERWWPQAWYSNHGDGVALTAPGGSQWEVMWDGVLSTLNTGTTVPRGDRLAYLSGTSMAAPHVAGVAALLLSQRPSLTPDQVGTALSDSARGAFSCYGCGGGLLDAAAAVRQVLGSGSPQRQEQEPNGGPTTATPVPSQALVRGRLGAGDQDWYTVTVPTGEWLRVALIPGSVDADYDLVLRDADDDDRIVAFSIEFAGYSDAVSYKNVSTGPRRLHVQLVYFEGPAGGYTLKLR